MTKKLRVALLFGGRSVEHEISCLSAKSVYEALDQTIYEPVLIKIDLKGRLIPLSEEQFLLEAEQSFSAAEKTKSKHLLITPSDHEEKLMTSDGKSFKAIDVAFPILHGPCGEDGTIQGLLRLANIPFIGSGVLSCSLAMDKAMTKQILLSHGLPTCPFLVLKKYEKNKYSFEDIKAKFGLPFFVKSVSLGSSVGVSKVSEKEEFLPALEESFSYDEKLIIEPFVDAKEVEVGVLGCDEDVKASVVGEIRTEHDFYSYAAKYTETEDLKLEIPAKIPESSAEKLRETAVKVFRALDCCGLARCDFFLKKDGTIFVNEVNPIPGFTQYSMYPKLWEATGIPYAELIKRLIDIAIRKHKDINELKTQYD